MAAGGHRRIDSGWPAPCQNGGCGFWMVGGSTMMSSNCQYLPWNENRSFEIQDLVMMSMASSKRGSAFLHRDAEAGEFVVAVAFADAEIQPAAGQQVDGRRLFGQQHGIVPGQHDHRRAQPQRRGPGADPGQQVQRRGDLAEAGEVMLDDEGAVIAQRFGLDEVFDVVVEAGRAVDIRGAAALRLSRAKQSEAHG